MAMIVVRDLTNFCIPQSTKAFPVSFAALFILGPLGTISVC